MTKGLEYLSHSRLEAYRQCSLKFAYQYVERLTPAFTPSALCFGIAFHSACEKALVSLLSGDSPRVEELLAVFEATFDFDEQGAARQIRYSGKESRESLLALAGEMLKAWVAWPRPPEARIISVEHEFSVQIGEGLPDFHGRIDLIEETPTHVQIIDLKTSRAKWSQDTDVIQHAGQLVLYREAVRDLIAALNKPVRLGFEVVSKGKSPQVERLYVPDEMIEGIDRQIRSAEIVVKAVEHSIFLPSPGWQCFGCGFRKACAKWASVETKPHAPGLRVAAK